MQNAIYWVIINICEPSEIGRFYDVDIKFSVLITSYRGWDGGVARQLGKNRIDDQRWIQFSFIPVLCSRVMQSTVSGSLSLF